MSRLWSVSLPLRDSRRRWAVRWPPDRRPRPKRRPSARVGARSAKPKAGEAVNLNTATVQELDALPGVGPVTAAAIVAWRQANGRFTSVDQLADVEGIGPARLEKLRALVRV